ncbi:MAG: TonB-dependent receptor [Solimonas sp.]
MHRPRASARRAGCHFGTLDIAAAFAAALACHAAFAQEPVQDEPLQKSEAASGAPAQAAEAAQGDAAAPGGGNADVAEVVVTAQKRAERLLDVPMSVAAVSGEDLASAGVGSTVDIGQITPGVVMSNIGTGFIPSIRGVSSSGTSTGDESNVALYIDDVYVGDTLAGMFDLPDIDHIEVLKGPQGTLFGRNATGGALRIVTRAPSFERQIDLSADYGFNFRESKLSTYVTGPVSERVAGSLSAATRNSDGFVDGSGPNIGKEYGKADNYMFRGKLLFNVSDDFQMTFAADTSKSNNESGALATPPEDNNPYPGSVPNTPYHYAGSTQPIQDVRTYSASLDANWKISDEVSVRSISAYRDFDLVYQVDIDRTSEPLSALALEAKQHNFSQEFNVFGPGNKAVTWLVGAFYYNSTAGNPYFTSYIGDAPTGTVYSNFKNDQSTEAYAGFADVTWNATARLHLTGGARYSSETKDYHYEDTVRAGGAALRDVSADETWSSPTYRAVARFDITPDSNVYASWSNGFKSGVFNTFSPLPIPVKPEKIDAIEIGAKARLPLGMTVSAAAYDYRYDDLQVQAQTIVDNVPVLTLTNAANARIRGVELNLSGKVVGGLSFNVGGNWLPKADYADYRTAQVTVPVTDSAPITGMQVVPYDASGSRLVKAPKWTANLGLTYTAPLMSGVFVATANDAYNSGFNWQAGDLPPEQSAFNVVNARVSWTDPGSRYTFSVWSTNLTDEVYSTYSAPNPRGNTSTYSQPRQVGVGISAKF